MLPFTYGRWPNLAYRYGISTDWVDFCFSCCLLRAARERQQVQPAVPPQLCSSTPQQNKLVVCGHYFKAYEKGLGLANAELWTTWCFSTEDNETSKEFKWELLQKKKKNNHAFAFSFLFQCKSEEHGSKRTKVTSPFFSPYVANKSMLFDPNVDTIQTVISVECKLFI